MDTETLLHVESDLRKQNAAVDKHVASMHGRMDKLRFKQQELEKEYKKLDAAKGWEVGQKESRAKELEHARAEMESKRLQTQLLAEQGAKLRRDIGELERKMNFLRTEERVLKEKYSRPSLAEVVMNEAEKMGSVPQHLANKTVENILPELQIGLKEAGVFHQQIERMSSTSTLFVSICVYILGISLLCLTYRCVQSLQKMITLPRMLFTIDMAFVVMWSLIILCFGSILRDPLEVMASNHITLSIIIQILIMASLVGNVLMRCLLVSAKPKTWSFVELFWTVFTSQHYYQAVWVPFLLDQDMKSNFASYSGYLFVHCTLGIYRARSIGKGQLLRRPEGFEMEEGSFLNQTRGLRHKTEKVMQYLEDLLTTGCTVSSNDFDALSDDDNVDESLSFRRKWENRAGKWNFSKDRGS